jgi:DNA-directed RNA polymerase I subunit RPA1
LTSCKGAKVCPHCGAHSPKIRQDSANKFFQAPLTDSAKRINEAEGIILEPALKGSVQSTIIEEEEDEDSVDNTSDDETAATKGKRKTSGGGRDKFLHPAEVQAQLKKTWETTPDLCGELFAKQGPSVFFLQAIAVPPNRFRPPMGLGGMVVEHSQNFYLSKILVTNENVRNSFTSNTEAIAYKHWIDLQTHVNCFMDSSKDPSLNQNAPVGIRQLLERKEGIFRKHMMGKRVDYACRSVISPDPYVGTNEIGIPRHFAVTLTYPTPVTDINIQEMRKLVERGPNNYPGARWVEFPDRRVDLSKMDQHKREAVAARMLSHAKMGGKPAIVGRQLRDGDMVLMNRQVSNFPTPFFQRSPMKSHLVMHHSEKAHVRL